MLVGSPCKLTQLWPSGMVFLWVLNTCSWLTSNAPLSTARGNAQWATCDIVRCLTWCHVDMYMQIGHRELIHNVMYPGPIAFVYHLFSEFRYEWMYLVWWVRGVNHSIEALWWLIPYSEIFCSLLEPLVDNKLGLLIAASNVQAGDTHLWTRSCNTRICLWLYTGWGKL